MNRFTRLGVPDCFAKLHQIGTLLSRNSRPVSQATSDYTIVQRYTRQPVSYWFCRPA